MQSSDQEPEGTLLQESELSTARNGEEPTPWILGLLFPDPRHQYRSLGSLILGLTGVVLTALFCCFVLTTVASWLSDFPTLSEFARAATGIAGFLTFTAATVTSLFAAQLIAFCHLPISVRLSLVIGLIVACLSICISSVNTSLEAYVILFCLPFCLGGFTLRRLASLRAIHWDQKIEDPKITILWMMDATSAIAILLALISAVPEFDYRGLFCFVPITVLFGLFGFPLCARMNALSLSRTSRESGFGMWMAANVFVAFLVFLVFVVANNSSPIALIGFIAAPGTIAVAHYTTELQILWLRGCGWTLVSLSKTKRGIEEL